MVTASELKKIWLKAANDNPEFQNRVNEGIEKNRKGDFKIRFVDSDGKPCKNITVRANQKTHEFKFGAHIFMLDEFESAEDNKKFSEMFKEYFNLATVPFYWDGLEPEQDKPRYDKDSPKVYRRPAPDLCMQYCEQNGIDAKLHCLVYDKFTPDWLPKNDMAQMERFYEKRFKEISERYAGKMYEFEVINETLHIHRWENDSVITSKKDLNEWAFSLAKKYFPHDTLVINDGGVNEDVARKGRWSAYCLEIENALLKGLPIDKIGIQHHLFTGAKAKTEQQYEQDIKQEYLGFADPEVSFRMLDALGSFGLPLELTEVTIPTFGDGEEYEELQAELLKMLYSVWFSHPMVNTVVYWNQIDGYCYVGSENWNENNCRGGLFHHDLTPKKSALMLKKLITEQWHTDKSLVTDKNGEADFRGFYGDYDIEIISDGKAVTTRVSFCSKSDNDVTITL